MAVAKGDYVNLIHNAHIAGQIAARECVPTPMVVKGYESTPVMGGVCGFAWIEVRPRTSPLAKWLKTQGHSSSDYHKAVLVWVHQYGQSMARKEAYARAYAQVLRDSGYVAYANSRID